MGFELTGNNCQNNRVDVMLCEGEGDFNRICLEECY